VLKFLYERQHRPENEAEKKMESANVMPLDKRKVKAA